MRIRTKKLNAVNIHLKLCVTPTVAKFRGFGHFRSFRTNYGFLTPGKDRMPVFTPNSVKKYFMGCEV